MKKMIFFVIFLFVMSSCEASGLNPTLNKGMDTVYQNEVWIDEGANLVIGFRKIPMQAMNTISTHTLGTFIVTYQIEHEGVIYQVKRYIQVIPKEIPLVELNQGIDTIQVGGIWIDAGISSDAQIDYTVVGSVDTSQVGTYKIEYIVTYLGHTFIKVRYVNVLS